MWLDVVPCEVDLELDVVDLELGEVGSGAE